MRRTESLPMFRTMTAVLALAGAVVLTPALSGTDAEGKKKKGKGGGAVAVDTSQADILDAGAIRLRGGNGTVTVRALSAGKVSGVLARGKKRSAKLTDAGRTLLSGCTVEGLSTKTVSKKKGKKGKKRSRVRSSSITLDLAVCSVGSENPTAKPYKGPAIDTTNSDRCDFLDPAVCLQPWPNDHFTVSDPTTDTGRRLDFDQASMPKNKLGVPIDVSDYLRADGFSPGNQIIVKIPGLETPAAFQNTGFVPITNQRKYDDEGQPIAVINAATGERQPVFAELDANPPNPADVNLIVRPLRNFDHGARYIVVLRGLRDAQNRAIEPPTPFRAYRDRLITQQAEFEARRPHMESLFSTLQNHGYSRGNLYMAWDFTVASQDSVTGRALALRDDAFTALGDTDLDDGTIQGASPAFDIGAVTDFVPCGGDGCQAGESDSLLRQINGTLTDVPCYLAQGSANCQPGASFGFNPGSDDPIVNPVTTAQDIGANGVRFRCIVPRSVVEGGTLHPAKAGMYGHGLLGNLTQVNSVGTVRNNLANNHNSLWCATNWAGFSDDDQATVLASLGNLSNFRLLVDRMQQGFVNMLYLGRAMAHPDGLRDNAAFEIDPDGGGGEAPGSAFENTDDLYFEGISQGAIMGGALTALSPDFTRSVLNVPGMNYSTLLRRSVDFDEYAEGIFEGSNTALGLYDNYPSFIERPLIISMMQLLWDRGESNGYAHFATGSPLPNTPPHQVLLQLAYGDHQVSNVAAEVQARTYGARVMLPALDPGRHWDVNPFMQIPAITSYPYNGSAIVYYDGGPLGFNGIDGGGTLNPPNGNVPPRETDGYGDDPHGYPRRSDDGVPHAVTFLQPNGFILPCTDPGPVARPCYANGWTGP